jgi:hypothetical protein
MNTFSIVPFPDCTVFSDFDKLVNRLTDQPITLLCDESFSEDDLLSDENKLMYIFVETDQDENQKYLGFCRIMKSQLCVDRFEIFSEYRLKGYGRIFVNKIKQEFGIVEYYQILDDVIGFWTKMFSNKNNLFREMIEGVLNGTETFDKFCKRLNYCEQDKAYDVFKSILEAN